MSNIPFDKPHRLKTPDGNNFNYSAMGSYMVTFNTKNRNRILSEIVCPQGDPEKAQVILSDIGKTLENYILQIPAHYKNVFVDSYIIMPDHVHILFTFADEQFSGNYENSRLSKIVKTLKTLITKNIGFSIWQLDYYDSVVFSDKAYDAFVSYIQRNPAVWFCENGAEPKLD